MAEKIEQGGGDVPTPRTKRKIAETGQSGSKRTLPSSGDEQLQPAKLRHTSVFDDEQTMQPLTTPLEDLRTLALREAHHKLKRFYTKPARYSQLINLTVVERPPMVDKTKKDVMEFLEATTHGIDRYVSKEKKLEYKYILTSTGSDSGKRVLISGPPGSGKTILAHQLCRDLYSGHLPNPYQLVLFAELKAFRSFTSRQNKEAGLHTLLEYLGLPETDRLCSMIEKEKGRGVAIILDGYDEISDASSETLAEWVSEVFCDRHLPVSECDVFITTRPSQLSQLVRVAASVHLEVLGFSSSDINRYIKAYFDGAPDRAEEVIHRLTGLPLVLDLCSNPRVLEIACKVLKHLDEEPLPANLSGIFLRYICYQLEVSLSQRQPRSINRRIKDLLSIPQELFPGFYTLCSQAYHCCVLQQFVLEKQELGEVKKYIDSRGTVYNLLFGEEVDSPSYMSCIQYQCVHKTVMEALAAVHIAVLSPAEQQQIWEAWFTAPHMAQVWMMYCGLTGLKSVDLRRLCSLIVSMDSREVEKDLHSCKLQKFKDDLVMVSLFEASNDEEAKRILPALLKNTIRGDIRSQYEVLFLAYSIVHHPHLSRVKLNLLFEAVWSELDLQPLTTSLKSVKAVELECKENIMELMLAVLPRAVEDLSLHFTGGITSYKGLGDALKDCHCLRSLTIIGDDNSALRTELDIVRSSNRLTKFHVKGRYVSGEDRFKEDYLKAVEAHGCIELTITKCTTIGPPHIGKTCLKHLLTNTRWDASNVLSTEAMRAPEWVECFRATGQQWTTLSREDRIQSLYRSIASNDYAPPQPKPSNSVAEHESSSRGQLLTIEQTKSTISTESKPDPSTLVPEQAMDTSPLNHPSVLASEVATPKSDPTASEEYKLLNSKLSSLIPDKLQEDEEKKGQTLHKMQILHFIDTGGQSVYHDVHPVLITSPSVYLVVFNLEKCFQDDFLSSDLTQQALRSIHTLASKKPVWGDHFQYRPKQPKIFIIGTHLDKLITHLEKSDFSLDKVLEEMHVNIQKNMVGMPYRNYIMYDTNGHCFWAVNNRQAGEKTDEETAEYLKDLREMIVEESMTMCVKLPITWIILEHIAANCKPIFEYDNIFQMARDRQLVDDKKEFDALLHVFHILGLFFVPPDDASDAPGSTKTYIFTDPNLLYSLTSHLLLHLVEPRSENLQPTRGDIRNAIPRLIHTMVEKKQLKEAINIDPDWFISLLCQLRLMAPRGEDDTSKCIIPAILPNGSVPFEDPSVIRVSLLLTYYIQHSGFSFVPSGLFCALIADILRSKSPSSSWEPQDLYRRQVVFKVDFGEVCIRENHSNIQFDVKFNKSHVQAGLSAEQQYCNRLREELCERLVAIGGSLYQQSKSDFDAVAMWGIPCQYHKNERDPSHLAVCYKLPQTDLYCATCKGPPSQSKAPFQILSDKDIIWFADKFRRMQV